jgi:glyoxylase-like metal-dependent hydrolase (beta-lactamase superfamily II)
VIGSVGCQQALEEDGAVKFAEMAGRSPELKTKFPDLELGLMQITFPQEISLHLPGVDIRLIYYAHKGKSHSRGDTIAVLEQEQIVFAGDLLYTDFHQSLFMATFRTGSSLITYHTEMSLCRSRTGRPHGGNDAYQDALLRFRSYLDDFYGRLMEVKSGKKSGEIESYMKGTTTFRWENLDGEEKHRIFLEGR